MQGIEGPGIWIKDMAFWVYVLRCSDGSYYTGHTDNIRNRMAEHQTGIVESYTSTRRPVELVFDQHFPTRDVALAAEWQINGWSRKKKQALIRGDWKEIQRLSWGTRNPMPDRLKSSFPFMLRYLSTNGVNWPAMVSKGLPYGIEMPVLWYRKACPERRISKGPPAQLNPSLIFSTANLAK